MTFSGFMVTNTGVIMEWDYEGFRDKYKYPHCELSKKFTSAVKKPSEIAHLHYNIEMLCAFEGVFELALYDLSECKYKMTLSPGEFIIVNCNILHRTIGSNMCRYYVAFIPPDSLMPQLRLGVGETFNRPATDSDGKVLELLRLMTDHDQSKDNGMSESVKAALMISLANAAAAMMLTKLSDKRVKIRAAGDGEDVFTYVFKNFRSFELSPKQLSSAFGYSSDKLSELFHDKFGVGVRQYITNLRINAAKTLLIATSDSVETISHNVGFDCLRTFYRAFLAETGLTPTRFREQNR